MGRRRYRSHRALGLSRALWLGKRDRARARTLAVQAHRRYVEHAPATDPDRAKAAAWLAARGWAAR